MRLGPRAGAGAAEVEGARTVDAAAGFMMEEKKLFTVPDDEPAECVALKEEKAEADE